MSDILIGVPTAIIIAAVSSWITVQLTLRKFRTEKWWERKVDAYTGIIEALHNSKEFTDRHLDAAQAGREVAEETDAELRAKSKAAYAEIRRAANIGAFLLSDQAVLRLSRFRQEEDEAQDTMSWNEHLIRDSMAVDSCLDDLIEIAKTDLKV